MFAELASKRLAPDLEDREKTSRATPEEKITALIYLSHVLEAQNKYCDAIHALTRAREIAGNTYPPKSLPVAYLDFLLGRAHWKNGEMEIAAQQMADGTSGMEYEMGWGHPTYLNALKDYELFLRQTHRMSEAAEVKIRIARSGKPRTEVAAAEGQALSILP